MFKSSFQTLLTAAAAGSLVVACNQPLKLDSFPSTNPTEAKTAQSAESVRPCDKFHTIVTELRTAGNKAKQLDYTNLDVLRGSFNSSGIKGTIHGGININAYPTVEDFNKRFLANRTADTLKAYITLENGAKLTVVKTTNSEIKVGGVYTPKNTKDPIVAIDSDINEKTGNIAILTQNQLPKSQNPTNKDQDFCGE
jgi:hypothetical protein